MNTKFEITTHQREAGTSRPRDLLVFSVAVQFPLSPPPAPHREAASRPRPRLPLPERLPRASPTASPVLRQTDTRFPPAGLRSESSGAHGGCTCLRHCPHHGARSRSWASETGLGIILPAGASHAPCSRSLAQTRCLGKQTLFPHLSTSSTRTGACSLWLQKKIKKKPSANWAAPSP